MTYFDNFDFEPFAEISLTKLKHNLEFIRSKLMGAKFIAVVKSDAYGHGIELAKYIDKYCDAFAVSRLNEIISLRYFGITKPIISLVPFSLESARVAIGYQAQICIPNYEYFKELNSWKLSEEIFVNFAIDSGMNRMGFSDKNIFEDTLRTVAKNKHIIPCGIYSHFSNAQSIHNCDKQFLVFKDFLNIYDDMFDGVRHISASGGLLHEKYNLDAVRVGILIYGYKPFECDAQVEPIMKILAKPISIRSFDGEKCLYNADTNVGEYSLINYGYADGLSRKSMPTRCMDLSYVSGSGEVVEVMNDANIIANENNTINYEVLVKSAIRIKKKYIGDI